ncbi:hypothetical protein Tco_0303238 [Tanacetum coccineum]
MPRDCLRIIESKSKVRNSRNKPVVAKVSTSNSTPGISPDVAELKDMVKALLLDKKNQSQAPATVKAVEENCVTCGGAHSYRNCPATDGNVYRDNIQEYVSQAAVANFNQGNTGYRPPIANQIRPPGFPPARIRRIFLDEYGVLVVRIVIFKISSFKLQNARLLLIFTKYSIITAILKYKRLNRYMDNKLGEAIHKAIQSHNAECREEAQAEKQDYIDLILPKAVSDFTTLVIERNVTESLEAVVLAKSSSQLKSTYEASASLSEYELTKILLGKMEESKSHLRADYKRKLYDALGRLRCKGVPKQIIGVVPKGLALRYKQKDKDRRIMGLAAAGPVELWRCWPHQSSVWYVSGMPQVSSLRKSHRMPAWPPSSLTGASSVALGALAAASGYLSDPRATQAHVSSISIQIYNLTSLAISITGSAGAITVNP